jgi:PAS domain S-box-containing protein
MKPNEIRILVVDDDASVARGTAYLLTQAGYATAIAADGVEALQSIPSFRPHLVLSDRDMPKMDGLELCRRIKSDPALHDVFVILASNNYTGSEELSEGLDAGADGYIARPIANRELTARIAAFVRILRLNRALVESEASAQASKRQYDRLAANIPAGVYQLRTTPNGGFAFEYVSPKLADMLNLAAAEILADPQKAFHPIHPEDVPALVKLNQECIAARQPFSWEGRMVTEATLKWLHIESRPEPQADGSVLWYGTVNDITERKRAEEKLRDSKARLQLATASAKAGVWDWNLQTGEMIWDDRMLELYGYTPEDFPGGVEAWEQGLHPEDAAWAKAECQASLRGEGDFDAEFRVRHPDGTVLHIKANGLVLRDEHGKPLRMLGLNIDITERKRAEAALQESETRHRTLADSGQALIWTAGLDKKCDYFNQPWLTFTGRTLAQELGDGWIEGVHPDDLQRCVEIYCRSFDRRESFSMDYRLRHHDGEFRWIQDNGTPRYDGQGNFLGYIGHCLDITERKQAGEMLRASEEQHRNLIHNLNVGIVVHASDTRILLFNNTALTLLGLSAEQMVGKVASDPAWYFVRETGGRIPLENYPVMQVLATRRPLVNFVVGINHPIGGVRTWVQVNAFPEFDGQQQLHKIVVAFQDITERKRAEEALKDAQQLYESLFQSSPAAIVLTTAAEGRFLAVNPAHETMTGYRAEEVIGHTVAEFPAYQTPDDRARLIQRLRKEGSLNNEEMVFRRRSGELFPVLLSMVPLVVGGQDCILSILHDIKARVQLEEQLRQAQKLDSIGQLAGGVAHDFNNMLAATMMNLSSLQERPSLDPETQETVAELMAEAKRAAHLTQQLLLFSRRSVMMVKVVDLNDLVANLLKLLGRLIGEHIKLSFDRSSVVPAVVADAGMIEQVLMNLAVNARDDAQRRVPFHWHRTAPSRCRSSQRQARRATRPLRVSRRGRHRLRHG